MEEYWVMSWHMAKYRLNIFAVHAGHNMPLGGALVPALPALHRGKDIVQRQDRMVYMQLHRFLPSAKLKT